jgi:hypothetical protein
MERRPPGHGARSHDPLSRMYVHLFFFVFLATIAHPAAIAIYKPEDVRPILQAYQGKSIPVEYAKKEAEAKAKHIEGWKHKKGVNRSSFASLLGHNVSPFLPFLFPSSYTLTLLIILPSAPPKTESKCPSSVNIRHPPHLPRAETLRGTNAVPGGAAVYSRS